MKKFSDKNGKSYVIDVNVASIQAVKVGADIDLFRVTDKDVVDSLLGDVEKTVQVIWSLVECEPANKATLPTATEFGRGMSGDSLEAATDLFWEDLADFFPSRQRSILKKLLATSKELADMAMDRVDKRISSPELRKAAEASVDKMMAEMDHDLHKHLH